MKKVGNYLIDMDRYLGHGQYGKVYLAQEMAIAADQPTNAQNQSVAEKPKEA